jgi:hypothetical protein
MNRLRMLPRRLFAALAIAGLAACAGTPPKAAPEPLPEDTLDNDSAAVAFPDEASAPAAPEPELEVPAVEDLPGACSSLCEPRKPWLTEPQVSARACRSSSL